MTLGMLTGLFVAVAAFTCGLCVAKRDIGVEIVAGLKEFRDKQDRDEE
jgi:hypothetical protein